MQVFSSRLRLQCSVRVRVHDNIAKSEGSIPMSENEELQVIEQDQGDGWTRVRRNRPNGEWEEGFVPTTYIEIIESTMYA